MDNAETIYKELRHEAAAIWYISDDTILPGHHG